MLQSPTLTFGKAGTRVLACLTAALIGATTVQSASDVTVFSGATLIDGTGKEAQSEAVLIVREGRIVCAGAAADCPVPAGAANVDLSNKWITPGLVDAHVHFAQTGWADGRPDGLDVTEQYPYAAVVARQRDNVASAYRSYLCSGVTAVFDVGGFPWSWQLRDDPTSGAAVPAGNSSGLLPPHVAAAGPLLTWVSPRMSLPAEQVMIQITGPENGREVVRYLKSFSSDAVKVWFLGVPGPREPGTPSREEEIDAWVRAVGEEAQALGLPLIVHATSLREAKVAVRAGARLLVHSVSDQPIDEEFLSLAREQGTIYTPTLIVSENWWAMYESAYTGKTPSLDDPNGCIDPASRAKIESTSSYRSHPAITRLGEERVAARRESLQRQRKLLAENLRKVHSAGIPVAMGTDAGNPFTVHGPSVYAEMERMREAGLTAAEILVISTRNGARAMGREDIGTLEAGKRADFLVLEKDPLQDVAAFRSLTHVAREGRLAAVADLSFADAEN